MNTVEYDLARNKMWSEIFVGKSKVTEGMKFTYAKQFGLLPHEITPKNWRRLIPLPEKEIKLNEAYNPITIIESAAVELADKPEPICKKKGKTMFHDDFDFETTTDEGKKRNYLVSRLERVDYDKQRELDHMFKITDDSPPATFDDFLARLSSGKYTLPEEMKKRYKGYGYSTLVSFIRWRDPAVKADEAGREAAGLELNKAYTNALDQIKIADPADGLKAVQSLEAWTPTTKAN